MCSLQAAQTPPQAEDESYVQGQSSTIINPVPVQNGICSGTSVSREGTGQYCQVSLTCNFMPSIPVFSVRGHNHDNLVHCIHCFPFNGSPRYRLDSSQPLEKFGMGFIRRGKLLHFFQCTQLVHVFIQPEFLGVTSGVSFGI